MRKETIEKLCCPFDKSDLQLKEITKTVDGNILEGYFTCRSCLRIYPIVKGIPIMNPDEYREQQFEAPLLERWKKHLPNEGVENFRLKEG